MLDTKIIPGETEGTKEELTRRAEEVFQRVGGNYYQGLVNELGVDAERVVRLPVSLNDGIAHDRLDFTIHIVDEYKTERAKRNNPQGGDYIDQLFGKYMQHLARKNPHAAMLDLSTIRNFSGVVDFREFAEKHREEIREAYIADKGSNTGFDKFFEEEVGKLQSNRDGKL
jgi:hypothetical protein